MLANATQNATQGEEGEEGSTVSNSTDGASGWLNLATPMPRDVIPARTRQAFFDGRSTLSMHPCAHFMHVHALTHEYT